MTDHDRGAYTPYHDAPLSFDARSSQGRRAFPTTLLVSLVILAGLGGGIFMVYRSGVRGAGQPPAAVGAPVGDIKSPPPQPAEAVAAAPDLQIYKSEGGQGQAASPPSFAPPPEQPRPRPAPSAPIAALPIAPAASAPSPAMVAAGGATEAAAPPAKVVVLSTPKAVAVKPAPVKAVPAKAVPTKAVPAKAAPAEDEIASLLDDGKPAERATAVAAPPAVKPVAARVASGAATGPAMVQIGAYSSQTLAAKEWSDLKGAYGSDMAGKGQLIQAAPHNGKTLYRTAVSGFSSREAAAAFCEKLKAAGRACIVR